MSYQDQEAWIIARRFGKKTTEAQDKLEEMGYSVETFFRTYHFEPATEKREKPDLIVTDGVCKKKNDYGESVAVYFDAPYEYANEHSITLWSFLWLDFRHWFFNLF